MYRAVQKAGVVRTGLYGDLFLLEVRGQIIHCIEKAEGAGQLIQAGLLCFLRFTVDRLPFWALTAAIKSAIGHAHQAGHSRVVCESQALFVGEGGLLFNLDSCPSVVWGYWV